MKICELRVDPPGEREKLVMAIANCGYKVWVEARVNDDYIPDIGYYVIIENSEDKVGDDE